MTAVTSEIPVIGINTANAARLGIVYSSPDTTVTGPYATGLRTIQIPRTRAIPNPIATGIAVRMMCCQIRSAMSSRCSKIQPKSMSGCPGIMPSAPPDRRPGRPARARPGTPGPMAGAHPLGDHVDRDEARHRPGPIRDDADLDAGVEEQRQRVAQGRPLVEQRRGRIGHRLDEGPLERQPFGVEPADRLPGRTDEEEEPERIRQAAPTRFAGVVPMVTVGAGWSVRSSIRLRARRLRPRSAPTNRATNSEAGLASRSAGGPELGQLAADLEDRDEVAHLDRLIDVVGHEQDRLGDLLLKAQELVLEPLAHDRVDGTERLVHEHDRRVRGEGAGDADALPLAARSWLG